MLSRHAGFVSDSWAFLFIAHKIHSTELRFLACKLICIKFKVSSLIGSISFVLRTAARYYIVIKQVFGAAIHTTQMSLIT